MGDSFSHFIITPFWIIILANVCPTGCLTNAAFPGGALALCRAFGSFKSAPSLFETHTCVFLRESRLGHIPYWENCLFTYLGALEQCLQSTDPLGLLMPIYDLVQASHLMQIPPALLLSGTERLTLWARIHLSKSIMNLPFMFTPGAS